MMTTCTHHTSTQYSVGRWLLTRRTEAMCARLYGPLCDSILFCLYLSWVCECVCVNMCICFWNYASPYLVRRFWTRHTRPTIRFISAACRLLLLWIAFFSSVAALPCACIWKNECRRQTMNRLLNHSLSNATLMLFLSSLMLWLSTDFCFVRKCVLHKVNWNAWHLHFFCGLCLALFSVCEDMKIETSCAELARALSIWASSWHMLFESSLHSALSAAILFTWTHWF